MRTVLQCGGEGAVRTERILIQMDDDLEAVAARSTRRLPGQEGIGQRDGPSARDGQDISAEPSPAEIKGSAWTSGAATDAASRARSMARRISSASSGYADVGITR